MSGVLVTRDGVPIVNWFINNSQVVTAISGKNLTVFFLFT